MAALERAERRMKRSTNKVFHVAAVASVLYLFLLSGFLLGAFSAGINFWFVGLIIAAVMLVALYPAVFLIEVIEKSLAAQISE